MVTVEGDDLDHLVTQFLQELAYLDQKQGPETTTLLITPSLTDFEDYLETYQNLDGLLDSTPYRGRYQIASFHPDYYFEGAEENDIENYTNRSPVPIIHIINENDISRAVDFYGDIEKVPETNKATLKKLGAEKVLALFASFKPKP